MSHFSKSALTRAAMLTALIVPTLSACAGEQSYFTGNNQYYADRTNPVPEASGQKISPFDVRVYADATNPHPELMGFPNLSIANAPSPTSSKE